MKRGFTKLSYLITHGLAPYFHDELMIHHMSCALVKLLMKSSKKDKWILWLDFGIAQSTK